MAVIGIGQGLTLSPLTALGIPNVAGEDAGAASGVVNVAHQMGNALGLAILVSIAEIGAGGLGGRALLAHRVAMAMTGGTALLIWATLLVLALIVLPAARKRRAARARIGTARRLTTCSNQA
jgi:hypothetical protein